MNSQAKIKMKNKEKSYVKMFALSSQQKQKLGGLKHWSLVMYNASTRNAC